MLCVQQSVAIVLPYKKKTNEINVRDQLFDIVCNSKKNVIRYITR